MSAPAKKTYRPETRLVQSGTLRSPFGETSEAMFLTQGYVYDTAAQAEAAENLARAQSAEFREQALQDKWAIEVELLRTELQAARGR